MNATAKTSFAILVYLAGMTATTELAAADPGRSDDIRPYVGANYGRIEIDSDDFDDDSDNAYSLYAGMDLGLLFGVEAGYVNFGGSDNELFSTETDGFQLSGLIHFVNTDVLDVYARAGALMWETELETDLFDSTNDGTEFFWALGTDIYLVENAAIRVEYARYKVELDEDEGGVFEGSDYNLNQLSAGVKFSF